ncbi:hypothetical protein EMPG_10703 [Blastomyces silverae]|uniref:C6 finger domain transcription factor nscR n=1 Tax=Blastomyces silverae TaxID=2060906 RepID=A0A0H1B4A1_9EURO|nr:hypothetical protein EMPG_10703 [Blastomyces silverae]
MAIPAASLKTSTGTVSVRMRRSQVPETPARKGSRRRLVRSCSECSRRKQKCNRNWPCNNCAGSRAHLCRYDHTVKRCTSSVNRSAVEMSPPSSSNSDEYAEQTDSEILESLGYVAGSASSLSSEVLGTLPLDGFFHPPPGRNSTPNDPRRSQEAILELFPDRQVVDFLIQYFLQEINWIYETIYPPTFMERYASWWLQQAYQESEDIQFGILVLRLCLCSIQLLPHPNYPHERAIQCSLNEVEIRCQNAASVLDSFRPRHSSLTTIQHMFHYTSYLTNESKFRESWIVLADIIKEVHILELHLEHPRIKVSEFEMEMRRRIFGTIYMWDKWMSILQGHWPLIPETYSGIKLPQDALPAAPSVPGAPTPFTYRIIQMRLMIMLGSQKTPGEQPRVPSPASVSAIAESIETEIIATLPPPYSLSDFDGQFDNILPNIPLKRAGLRVAIIGTLTTVHRPYTGMLHEPNFTNLSSVKEQKAAFKLQKKLIECTIDTIRSTMRFAEMLLGGCKKYFVLSLVALEASVVLSLCVRGIRRNRRAYVRLSLQGIETFTENSELEGPTNAAFLEGLNFLNEMAHHSPIAAKGSQILRSLHQKLQMDAAVDDTAVDDAEHDPYSHIPAPIQQQQEQQHQQQQHQRRAQQETPWIPAASTGMMTGAVLASEQLGNILAGPPVTTSTCGPEMAMDPYTWSQMASHTLPPPAEMHHYAHAVPAANLSWYYDDALVDRYATSTL